MEHHLLKLNISLKSIVNKYREGKMKKNWKKSRIEKELK